MVVDFKQGMRFLGNLHQSLEIQFCCSIARMGDNLHEWVLHGVDDPLRILFLGSSLPAKAMNASDSDVKHAPVILIKINVALGIEDVEFCSQHQPDTIEKTGNAMQVPEIDRIASARNVRSMFCDS